MYHAALFFPKKKKNEFDALHMIEVLVLMNIGKKLFLGTAISILP